MFHSTNVTETRGAGSPMQMFKRRSHGLNPLSLTEEIFMPADSYRYSLIPWPKPAHLRPSVRAIYTIHYLRFFWKGLTPLFPQDSETDDDITPLPPQFITIPPLQSTSSAPPMTSSDPAKAMTSSDQAKATSPVSQTSSHDRDHFSMSSRHNSANSRHRSDSIQSDVWGSFNWTSWVGSYQSTKVVLDADGCHTNQQKVLIEIFLSVFDLEQFGLIYELIFIFVICTGLGASGIWLCCRCNGLYYLFSSLSIPLVLVFISCMHVRFKEGWLLLNNKSKQFLYKLGFV